MKAARLDAEIVVCNNKEDVGHKNNHAQIVGFNDDIHSLFSAA